MANEHDDPPHNDTKSFYANTLTVTGILAGITFAAMTFLIDSMTKFTFPEWFPATIDYTQMLIGGMAMLTVLLLILSTIGMITVVSGAITA
jgi:hypothetical protein